MIRGYSGFKCSTGSDSKAVKIKKIFFKVLAIQVAALIIGAITFLALRGNFLLANTQSFAEKNRLYRTGDEGIDDIDSYDVEFGLLPKTIVPLHYNLTLQLITPPKYLFGTKGAVQIVFKCIKETKVIVLHGRNLRLRYIFITPYMEGDTNNISWQYINSTQIPQKQLILAHLDKPLIPQSKYMLDISFGSMLSNLSIGVFNNSYLSNKKTVSRIASTQFQPSDARSVFPCFDEPGLKATFQLHLIHNKTYVSMSNMPQSKRILDDEWALVSFEKTPRMSVYHLSFVIGDIEPSTEQRVQGVQVWSRSDMISFENYALSVAPKILDFLEENAGVPFSLPKLDLVAVPNFFHSTMGNWGHVIFDESQLLYDPEKSTIENKVVVALAIAHKLAHQWFGNLVTPVLWNNLWLNEGFATYYKYLALNSLQPSWEILHLFIAHIYEALEMGSLVATQAMETYTHLNQALECFDEISYLKGGAIVRMLQHFIGEDNFSEGIKNYLWRYSYKSTTENNLWQSLSMWNQSEYSVQNIMTYWTNQSGYPVIEFIRNYDNKTAVVNQKPFSLDYDKDDERAEITNSSIWTIPVTYTHGLNLDWTTKTDFWLTKESEILTDLPGNNTWIIANVQQVGYYRVDYDDVNWELILKQLLENHKAIHVVNRAQILNDVLNLARSNRTEYSLALNMTKYLYLEKEYLPWQAAFLAFKYLDLMLAKSPAHKAWKIYILNLMTPLYQEFGWDAEIDDDNILSKFLQKNILKWSCGYEHKECIETALAKFQGWKSGFKENRSILADEKEVVLCTGIAKGITEDWELMWKRYLKENFQSERNILLKSLACTREINLLRKLLNRTMSSNSGIPLQDGSNVFVYIAENVYGRDLVYDFLKDHLDEISFRFGSFAFAGGTIVDQVTASLNRENAIEELQSILNGRQLSLQSMQNALKMAVQRSKNNLLWMKKKYGDVYEWLQDNTYQ